MVTDVLDITNLSVSYPDGTEALNGVTLSVAAGSRVALIGPNGAGKTTLLLAVMGGLKFGGRILVDGIELSAGTVNEVRSRCGMTFQNPDDQLFMPTLLEDVAFGPLNQGYAPSQAEARARAAIEAAGLLGLEHRSAHHASEGQKRSASLATILSMNVKLLLLDEPGGGLDFRSRRRLTEILAGRNEAMLMATHDMDMVLALCQRVVLLDGGRVEAVGSVEEILGDTALLAGHGLA
jgi:energy-coupling factor transporter ATP-binding protein EcfA2